MKPRSTKDLANTTNGHLAALPHQTLALRLPRTLMSTLACATALAALHDTCLPESMSASCYHFRCNAAAPDQSFCRLRRRTCLACAFGNSLRQTRPGAWPCPSSIFGMSTFSSLPELKRSSSIRLHAELGTGLNGRGNAIRLVFANQVGDTGCDDQAFRTRPRDHRQFWAAAFACDKTPMMAVDKLRPNLILLVPWETRQ